VRVRARAASSKTALGVPRYRFLISEKGGSGNECLRGEIVTRVALRWPRGMFFTREILLEKDSEPEAPKFSSNRGYKRKRSRKKFHGK